MKPFFFFSLIILSTFILTYQKDNETNSTTISNQKKENNNINKTLKNLNNTDNSININKTSNNTDNNQNKTLNDTSPKRPKHRRNRPNRPPPLRSTSKIPNDTSNMPNNDIYSLNDLTFDMVLRGGNFYKWFVILYSETCGHCEHARREIRKVFPDYKNSTSIRFAEIEINKNHLTNMRFDIEGVPYIFLLQNESIYEFDLFASAKNLKTFIDTDFKEVEEDLKPFPEMVPAYKVGLVVLTNIFRGITNMINDIIFDWGFEFEFTPMLLFISFIGFIVFIIFLELFCCAKFCPDEEKPKKKKKKDRKKLEEEKKKVEEEKKKIEEEKKKIEEEELEDEEEEEEDDGYEEELKKIEEKKKRNEEEKKKIEIEREKIKEKKMKKNKKNKDKNEKKDIINKEKEKENNNKKKKKE